MSNYYARIVRSARDGVWAYSLKSAVYIFGESFGDKIIDTIFSNIKKSAIGLSKTEIHKIFGNHNTHKINSAIAYLTQQKAIVKVSIPTNGRSKQLYIAA